jgi:hypothetical protein
MMNDWKEEKTPGEDERFLKHAEFMRSIQKLPDRGLHAKAQLGVAATFEVLDGLPDWARVGLAEKPASYRAWVRWSNGSGMRQHDKKGDVRGMAVKVIGVDGKKVIPGMEDARTQDFLCINQPVFAVRNADEFISLVKAIQNPLLALPRLIGALGFGRALSILSRAPKSLNVKITSLAWTPYYTAAPLSWGQAAVRCSFQPQLAVDPSVERGESATYLGDEMTARVQKGAVVYDFCIQPYENETTTPIEDHSIEWKTPWLTVGRLTVGQQDPKSAEGQKISEQIEKVAFDPWHARVEHRPLGNVMRARNHAYRLTTMNRGAAPEPQ